MKAKVNTAIFSALLVILASAFVLTPKRGYSDNENRYLAAMPEFSLESLFDGSFTRGFEDYVTDGFPLRDMWISLKSRLDLILGRGDTGGVYVTDDGSLIEMFTQIDYDRYIRNLGYLKEAAGGFGHLDSFKVMLVPTASEVWDYKIGRFTADVDQSQLLKQAGGLPLVDCLTPLEERREEYIYYRNDHHWTSLGAYYCYQQLMGDKALPLEDFGHEVLSEDFLGTTFSKAGIYFEKDVIDGYSYGSPTVQHNLSGDMLEGIYDRSYLDKKDKYSVFLSGNQALSVIDTGNQGGELLLVKDSYANTMVQFLLPHYSRIHVVDLRFFGMSLSGYVQQEGITDMLVVYNLKGFAAETSLHRIAG